MGVFHFMGAGKSVGAISCPIDYLEQALDKIDQNKANQEILHLFKNTGGIRHDEQHKGKIEAIVLFSSREIIRRETTQVFDGKAFRYQGCDAPGLVRDEISKNLRRVWRRVDPDVGRQVFWCEVDVDDYQDCFNKMVRVAYRFSPPGKQGKEIWCNMTSGSNAIQLALMSMARLTAVSTKHYLISQRRDFQPYVTLPPGIEIRPNKDHYFNQIPFIKFAIDNFGLYKVLKQLEDLNRPVKTEELLGYLKREAQFQGCTLENFRREYMLKLFGLGYIEYEQAHDTNTISEVGLEFLVNDLTELEQQLSLGDVDIVAESKQWEWFRKEVI